MKQLNLALSLFAEDHNDQYPWQISTNDSGVKEWVGTRKTFLLFAARSNEVNNPRVLWCPKDTGRRPSPSFIKPGLDNNNLSYSVGLDAREKEPLAPLFGDRNLVVDGRLLANGIYPVSTQQVVAWGAKNHQHAGNMPLNDGSVRQLNDQQLPPSLLFSRPRHQFHRHPLRAPGGGRRGTGLL